MVGRSADTPVEYDINFAGDSAKRPYSVTGILEITLLIADIIMPDRIYFCVLTGNVCAPFGENAFGSSG